MIELTTIELDTIQRLAQESFSQGTQIWAYGSRVNGTCHDTSDLDLVIHPAAGLKIADASDELRHFQEALQNSNIAILVDVFLWDSLPKNFQENIQQTYEAVEF